MKEVLEEMFENVDRWTRNDAGVIGILLAHP